MRGVKNCERGEQGVKVVPLQEVLMKRGVVASRLSFLMSSPMTEAGIDFAIAAFAEAVEELEPQLREETAEAPGSAEGGTKNVLT